ncbi:MAG: RDD family protein [Deltaproteobacteria bacterium]|nr:RDD family protein [Deltaproteobacteria bacterium]
MGASRYNVIFSGVIYPGKNRENVKRNLGKLLSLEPPQVDELFATKGAVIRQSTDLETALSFVKLFEEAGAVCTMQVAEGRAAHAAPFTPKTPAVKTIAVLPLNMIPADPLFAPSTVPRIGAWDQGFDTNRMDNPNLDFADIRLATVFSKAAGEDKQHFVFFFLAGQRRPFLVDASKIAFNEFPDVKCQMLFSSLRKFLHHLLHQAPQVMLDKPTYDFLKGAAPLLLKPEPIALATSLGKALETPEALAKIERLPVPEKESKTAAAWERVLAEKPKPAPQSLFKPETDKVKDHWRGPSLEMITARAPAAPLCRRILASSHTLFITSSLFLCMWIPVDLYMLAHSGSGIITTFRENLPGVPAARGLLLVAAALCAIYIEVLSEKPGGQTLGQKLAGVRVVTEDGQEAQGLDIWFMRFIGHTLQILTFGLALFACFYSKEKSGLADILSRTRQVTTQEKPALLWQPLPFLLFFTLVNTVFSYRQIWTSIPEGVILWCLGVLFWLGVFFGYRSWSRSLFTKAK